MHYTRKTHNPGTQAHRHTGIQTHLDHAHRGREREGERDTHTHTQSERDTRTDMQTCLGSAAPCVCACGCLSVRHSVSCVSVQLCVKVSVSLYVCVYELRSFRRFFVFLQNTKENLLGGASFGLVGSLWGAKWGFAESILCVCVCVCFSENFCKTWSWNGQGFRV